jgi:iron complex outermembrane receptor protein
MSQNVLVRMSATALCLMLTLSVLLVRPAMAQTPDATPQQNPPAAPRITVPEVTVVAQKEPANAQALPVSVTAVTAGMLERAGVTMVSEVAVVAPNTMFTEFSARKLSNARFRGIGSSPANPAITTFIDGVPQLSANSSSIELVAVDQIEFVRGPQSALFGRNALGGLISITSARPSLTGWTGRVSMPLGDSGTRELRGEVSGPLSSTVALGVGGGWGSRNGFTINTETGEPVDDRSAVFGKAQVLWLPTARWENRVIVSGERARDGDYALNDLDELRRNPYRTARDFEGFQDRDIMSATLLSRYVGNRMSFTSTTGLVRWKTIDATDLDYSNISLINRENTEEATQWTQEFRVASYAPVQISDSVAWHWQAGLSMFSQRFEQDAINTFAPFVLSEFVDFPVNQHSPQGTLKDTGVGAFGQVTFSFRSGLDVAFGARGDYETKEAELVTFFDPELGPSTELVTDETYGNLSPNVSVSYRVRPGLMVYATTGRGYKAGGFNPVAPTLEEAYNEERTWTIEGGAKSTWADGRLQANAAIFNIEWSDLQLNLPIPLGQGQFYISNVGSAASRGLEVELLARPVTGVDVFASVGLISARFGDGAVSSGEDVADNRLPFTPNFTAMAGAQFTHDVTPEARAFGRIELIQSGGFRYDDANRAGQDAYNLVNLRGGVEIRRATIELWARNLFDTVYIPTAFAYDGIAPSGFVGEMGRPRLLGLTLGFRF